MKAPEGWCEPSATTTGTSVSIPISIPSSESIDESNIPSFLRDELEVADTSEKDWRGE